MCKSQYVQCSADEKKWRILSPNSKKNEIDTIRRIQEFTKSLRIDVSKNLIVSHYFIKIQISNEVLQ